MKSILIVGLGRFGKHIAEKMYELGHEVMAIDNSEDRINSVLSIVANAQIGDSTNEDFLRTLGVSDFDVCFVTIAKDFQASLETTSLLKELSAQYVVARAERGVQRKFLLRNGADEVVYPEEQVAEWAAIRYTADHILDYMEIDDNFGVFEVTIPDSWIGKTVAEVDIRRKYSINILAFKMGKVFNCNILPNTVFDVDRTLLVVGELKNIEKCFKVKGDR